MRLRGSYNNNLGRLSGPDAFATVSGTVLANKVHHEFRLNHSYTQWSIDEKCYEQVNYSPFFLLSGCESLDDFYQSPPTDAQREQLSFILLYFIIIYSTSKLHKTMVQSLARGSVWARHIMTILCNGEPTTKIDDDQQNEIFRRRRNSSLSFTELFGSPRIHKLMIRHSGGYMTSFVPAIQTPAQKK